MPTPTLRPPSDTITARHRRAVGPWPLGISGDLPIVLVRIADIEHLDLVRELLQAQEYWRMKQLAVDLVILNERASSYVQDLQIALETLVRTSQSRPQIGGERPHGRDLRAARRPDFGRDAGLAGVRRACRAGRAARAALADQLDRAPEPQEPLGPRRRATAGATCAASERSPRRARRRRSSSSTASAASPRAAGNM